MQKEQLLVKRVQEFESLATTSSVQKAESEAEQKELLHRLQVLQDETKAQVLDLHKQVVISLLAQGSGHCKNFNRVLA